ncbi:MAG: N-acetyl-gamma-glutamyl-phosphate reductase [Dehalococcoidia bacterium]|nr:N-acetyl-gamma-glutamyl-phosphate reductase [Dehalococcoidia bacterium]
MRQIKVGIINVSGYAGVELARLIHQHEYAELCWVTGRSMAGRKVGDMFPHLFDIKLAIDAEPGDADVVFSALPHKASAEVVLPLVRRGIRTIDISADFRLKNSEEYTKWYGVTHLCPELLQEAVYGLPELHRAQIKSAHLVANPGCYPTSAILALAPAVKEGIIQPDIIVDSKSGVSGAGRSLSVATHYSEENESVSAYALAGHRHLPEIVQELETQSGGSSLSVTFIPHLVPMTRGILSTCYASLVDGRVKDGKTMAEQVRQVYSDFYREEPFVRVVDASPKTKYTWGSNFCLVYPTVDDRTRRLVVVSCIDNLVKGAAGQAIQNMNLMFGFPEDTGLNSLPIFP